MGLAGPAAGGQSGNVYGRGDGCAASFLIKHLGIHWLCGERWFWDTQGDADLANNADNLQRVAGCGTDAAPFFRTFDPVLQGEKFDPEGGYVRKFVPELKGMPARYVHRPWGGALTARKLPRTDSGIGSRPRARIGRVSSLEGLGSGV